MLKIIKSEIEYEDALENAYVLIQKDFTEGCIQADELELLTLLIQHYEKEHYPISPPSPIDTIKFRLDQLNKPEAALSKILGAMKHTVRNFKRED